jgi:hypothetical protein
VAQLAEPLELARVDVEHADLRAEAGEPDGRVAARLAGAEHGGARPRHPWGAAEQHAAPALRLLQEAGADLRGHAAGDPAHGREQGREAPGQLDRLVGDRGRAAGDQPARHRRVGGQVQEGEQHVVGPQPADLLGGGLLDLDDQPRLAEDVVGGGDDPRPGGDVLLVGDPRSRAGVPLDQHLVAVGGQLPCPGRAQGDPGFARLALLGHSNLHLRLRGPAVVPAAQPPTTTMRSSVISRTVKWGPSRVFPDSLVPP